MIRELPDILVNDRVNRALPRRAVSAVGRVMVDRKPVLWEACQTLNGSWGYHRDNLDWKSSEMLIRC